jgi:RHS repeat-associated protein
MNVRDLLLGFIAGLLTATSLAAQTPVLGSLEAPYPCIQNTVRIADTTYGPGAVAYGPVGTPLVLTGLNLGTSGIVQFIGYKNGAVDPGATVQATVTMWSSSMLFLTVPSGAVSGLVKVTVAGASSVNGLPYIVTPGAYSGSCPVSPPGTQLQITTASLPNGNVGQPYSAALNASGGTKPYTWSLTSGSLPSGLSLDASTGTISGAPSAVVGTIDLTFEVADSSVPFQSNQAVLSLTIGSQAFVPGTVYSYSITNAAGGSGYQANGNIQNYTDSVTGTWTVNYDTLNRIAGAQGTGTGNAMPDYCWSYDAFGNRTDEEQGTTAFTGGGAAACSPQLHQVYSYNANNQVSGGPVVPQYDSSGSGNIIVDTNGIQYLYDAEGRICAVNSGTVNGIPLMTGYIYDAEGRRVAKGPIASMTSCPTSLGPANETDYILDEAGNQVTEMASDSSGNMNWVHTNVWAAGQLIGTYSPTTNSSGQPDGALSFYLTDWLGTRRARTDYAGDLLQTCASLPYGDDDTCPPTPTEHLFTGKEHDSESGNDYFGARYYASTMGRFLSPDDGSDQDSIDPQSWNLYSYVRNNPLINTDPSGNDCVNLTNASLGIALVQTTQNPADCLKGYTYVNGAVNTGSFSRNDETGAVNVSISSYADGSGLAATVVSGGAASFNDSLMYNTFGPPSAGTWNNSGGAVNTMGALLATGASVVAPELLLEDTGLLSLGLEGAADEAKATEIAEYVTNHAYDKHVVKRGEFGNISREEFKAKVKDTIINHSDRRSLSNGRIAYWSDREQMVVIENQASPSQSTAFRPTNGKSYFDNDLH